jgi:hypothetical protein
MSVNKSLQVGNLIKIDTNYGQLQVSGITENRMFLDSTSNSNFYISVNGSEKQLDLTDTEFKISNVNTILSDRLILNNTNGNSFTFNGGGTVEGLTEFSSGITTISPNTIGSLITDSTGNINIEKKLNVSGETRLSNMINTIGNITTSETQVNFGTNQTQQSINITGDATINENLYVKNKLGINNISPQYALDIDGDINFTGLLTNSGNSVGWGGDENNNIFRESGNVGIGTTEPFSNASPGTSGLEVKGFVLTTSLNATSDISSPIFTGNELTISNSDETSSTSISAGNFITEIISTGSLNVNENIYTKNLVISNNISAGSLHLDDYIYKDNIKLNWDLTDNRNGIYKMSFVGIQNSDPKYDLDVLGNLNFTGNLTKNSKNITWEPNSDGNIYRLTRIGIGTSSPEVNLHVSGHVKIDNGSLNAVEHTNTIGNLYTNTNGVGIKVENPSVSLEISGDAIVTAGNLTVGNNIYTNGDIFLDGQFINGSLWIKSGNSGIEVTNIFVSNTQSSFSDTSGSIISNGGITIKSTENSANLQNGGSLLSLGGITINKDIFTGGKILQNSSIGNLYNILSYDGNDKTEFSLGRNVENDIPIFYVGRHDSSQSGNGEILEKTFEINNSSGQIYFNNTTPSTSYTSASLIMLGGIYIRDSTNSTSLDNGGAMTVSGGISISKDTRIGGDIICTSNTDTTSKSTGSVKISGGVGINRSLWVGGTITQDTQDSNLIDFKNSSSKKTQFGIGRDDSNNVFYIAKHDSSLSGNGELLEKTIEINNSTGKTTWNNTSSSTSISDASVIFRGGVSISESTDSTSTSNGGALTVAGGLAVGNKANIAGDTEITSTTQSTNENSGALKVAGGVGIGGNLTVGKDTVLMGNLTVNGETVTIVSKQTELEDNIILLNSGVDGSRDSGFLIKRYQTENDSGNGDVVADEHYITGQLPVQHSEYVNENFIQLADSSSNIDDFYKGWWILITDGNGSGQVRQIVSYTGNISGNIAQVNTPWNVQPVSGNNYRLFNRNYTGIIFNDESDTFELGATHISPDSTKANTRFTEYMPLKLYELISTSTVSSSNPTTGSVRISGSICISNSEQAVSSSSGGTFTTDGGMGVNKDLYVGGNLYVDNRKLNINAEDTMQSKQHSSNLPGTIQNQVNITDLIFDKNVTWSFDVYLASRLEIQDTDTNVYTYCTNYHIRGIYKTDTNSWEIAKTYVGDDTDIEFYISDSGQLGYTTPSSFKNITMKWRCLTN